MLAGYRVLVVEDEALIAQDIKEMLLEAEAVLVGPASGVGEARQLIRDGAIVDLALLDVNLGDEPVTPVLEALLHARGIPTLINTGDSIPDDVRRRHPELIALAKPVLPAHLIGQLRKLARASKASLSHR